MAADEGADGAHAKEESRSDGGGVKGGGVQEWQMRVEPQEVGGEVPVEQDE